MFVYLRFHYAILFHCGYRASNQVTKNTGRTEAKVIQYHTMLFYCAHSDRLIRVHLPAIKQMSIVGYATSLVLLLAAFTLLASLK